MICYQLKVGVALLDDLLRSALAGTIPEEAVVAGDEPRGVLGVEFGAPFSLTMFLHEDSLSSRAPTFLSKSPTMFRADNRAEGVKVEL